MSADRVCLIRQEAEWRGIQTINPLGTAQRMTYYGATLYVGQLTKCASDSSLRQAITICVLTESRFPEDPRLHLDFRMRDSSGLTLTDDLQIHLLELPKLQDFALEEPRMACVVFRGLAYFGHCEFPWLRRVRRSKKLRLDTEAAIAVGSGSNDRVAIAVGVSRE